MRLDQPLLATQYTIKGRFASRLTETGARELLLASYPDDGVSQPLPEYAMQLVKIWMLIQEVLPNRTFPMALKELEQNSVSKAHVDRLYNQGLVDVIRQAAINEKGHKVGDRVCVIPTEKLIRLYKENTNVISGAEDISPSES